MIYLLYLVAGLGGAYFFLQKRRADMLTVGFLGSFIYFLPGFFTEYDTALGHIILPDEAIFMFAFVLGSITATAIAVDILNVQVKPTRAIAHTQFLPVLTTVAMLGSFLVLFKMYGLSTFTEDKNNLDLSGALSILLRTFMSLAVVFSFSYKYKFGIITGVICMVTYLLLGDRTAAATIALAGVMLSFSDKPQSLYDRYKKYWPAMLAFGALMVYGKLIYSMVRPTNGDRLQIVQEYLSTKNPITTTEPFVTQIILKRVLESQFHIGTKYLSHAAILPLPVTGQVGNDFNKEFQPQLFPNANTFGLAHNFWAEGYAIGGWAGFFIFVAMYIGGLQALGYFVRSNCNMTRGLGAICGSYWAFYIQRNSIFNILTFEKQMVYVAFFMLLLALPLGHLADSLRSRRPVADAV